MQCEVCGAKTDLVKAKIENTILNVCNSCSSLGEIIQVHDQSKNIKRQQDFTSHRILRQDFGDKLREERIKRNMKLEKLASFLNEKVSVLKRVESNELMPDFQLLRKLGKHFSFEFYEGVPIISKQRIKSDNLTIGDIVQLRD